MKQKTKMELVKFSFLVLLCTLLVELTLAVPASPQITYVSNSTYTSASVNRSQDVKGTITTVNMDLKQQDYKWKAYVGNVTGTLALDDANSKSIYDWALSTISGEVYVSRSSSVTWANVSCVTQGVIDSEQSALGITATAADSINSTFNYTAHRSFLIGAKNITQDSCRSTATYINDAAQTVSSTAKFQEVLLRDEISSSLIYSTLIEQNQAGYDGSSTFDFQLILAENESSSVPTPYFFYVELG